MELTAKELEQLIVKYDEKANINMQKYQESGDARYLRAKEKAEDLVDALRMAANAKDDHDELGWLKLQVRTLAREFEEGKDIKGDLFFVAREVGFVPAEKVEDVKC